MTGNLGRRGAVIPMMKRNRTIWLVFNTASGSNDEAARAALEQDFADAGCTIDRKICFPGDDAPTPAEVEEAGVDLLAIFAGDGTVRALVTRFYGWDGRILVLPGGTMNLLSRNLHGEADAAQVIARFGADRARTVRPTVIRTRYGDALSGVLAGPGTSWNEVREAMRETDIAGILAGAGEAIGASAAGPKVVCRELDCGRDDGYSAINVTPDSDGLVAEGYYAETVADYARQAVALLQRDFRNGPHDVLGTRSVIRVACPEGEPMGLLIDGEPIDAAAEEEFTSARCGVDLLATADDD